MQQELEEAEAEGNTEAPDEGGSGASALPAGEAELVVKLWPFAYITSYWHHILDGLVGGSLTGVVAFLSPSTHPGSWVAARRLAQDVFVCARRFSNHARRHAIQLYDNLRRKDLEPSPSQVSEPEPAPVLPGLIRLRLVTTEQGAVEAYDVAPGSLWRDGLNLSTLFRGGVQIAGRPAGGGPVGKARVGDLRYRRQDRAWLGGGAVVPRRGGVAGLGPVL